MNTPVRKHHLRQKQNSRPEQITDLFTPVAAQLAQVRLRLTEHLTISHKRVSDQLETVGVGQGKLIRPALVLLSGLACGRLTEEHIELAAIVELVHTATLLHDDVIDQAKTRRNNQSVNRLWGNTIAVLLGDFLLSRAFISASQLRIAEAGSVLSQTAEDICRGELIQNVRKGDWSLTRQEYLDIIEAKTAGLFAAGCFLGAAASGADTRTAECLAEYGRCVGLAFQITDDILDITGSAKKTGKTLGTDFLQKKLTLPIIHLLEQQNPRQKKMLIEQFSTKPDRRNLLNLLVKSGSLDFADKTAGQYAQNAGKALACLPSTETIDGMKKIATAISLRI